METYCSTFEVQSQLEEQIQTQIQSESKTLRKRKQILVLKKETDPALARIKKNLYKFADKIQNSKTKAGGNALQRILEKNRKQIRKPKPKGDGNHLMNNILKVWRFCIYPYFPVNHMVFCKKTYTFKGKKRVKACQNLMCKFCCDNMNLIFKFQSINNILGSLFKLNSDAGYMQILELVPNYNIRKCRAVCNDVYPMVYPMVLKPPKKDPQLGKSKKCPAKSCIDIKKYGKDTPSGTYWIEFPNSGVVKVYCDMETAGGGWTLFFNYVHHPFEDNKINASKMPTNPDQSSCHIKLADLGIEQKDVRELRFFCRTRIDKKKVKIVHFKSENDDVIQLAFTENQKLLKPKSFIDDTVNLTVQKEANLETEIGKIPSKRNVWTNSDKNGGLWNRPFGSKGKGYWSVRGNTDKGIWECDDNYADDNNEQDGSAKTTDNRGSAFDTVHRVYYRGEPPTEDFARQRILRKLAQTKKRR